MSSLYDNKLAKKLLRYLNKATKAEPEYSIGDLDGKTFIQANVDQESN